MTPKKVMIIAGCVLGFIFLCIIWATCVPPYNTPIFENIDTNQTGFLIPLDAKTGDQVVFESIQFLQERKISAKRVQIPRRWVQTWWLPGTGLYVPTVRLVVVDRTPVIREWTETSTSGSNQVDDSLPAQSKDGTSLKLNFTCTAQVPEETDEVPHGTATFLYWYRGSSLADVMDREVRAKVQAISADFCSKYILDTLRGHQHDLVTEVRNEVIPFFEKRGVMITNIGLIGGFHYVNQNIQKAIDQTIVDQQLKVSALAQQEKQKVEQETKLLNQKIDNETMRLHAEGKAIAAAKAAEGTANARRIEAKGEADSIKLVAEAKAFEMAQIEKYKDIFLRIKELEVERAWRTQWRGTYPETLIQGSGAIPFFQLPRNPISKAEK